MGTQSQALSQDGYKLRYLPAHPPSHIVVCVPSIERRKIDGPAIGYQQWLVALREMGWGKLRMTFEKIRNSSAVKSEGG
jgi:hypothetical protein